MSPNWTSDHHFEHRPRDSACQKAKEANDEAAIEARRAELEKIKQRLTEITAEIKACVQWTTECFAPYSLVLADGVLVAGGDRHVVAVNAETGEELWKLAVPGKAYGLAVADDKLRQDPEFGKAMVLEAIACPVRPRCRQHQLAATG